MGIRSLISQVASSLYFDNSTNGYLSSNVQDAVEEGVTAALETPIYTLILQHNGTVSNNTFLGYDSLIPGDTTPIIVPKEAKFVAVAFSNSDSTADYTLQFRKNSLVVTPFYSVSKTNTKFFNQVLPSPELFAAGDQIYVKYIDDGNNASDATVVLQFRAEP